MYYNHQVYEFFYKDYFFPQHHKQKGISNHKNSRHRIGVLIVLTRYVLLDRTRNYWWVQWVHMATEEAELYFGGSLPFSIRARFISKSDKQAFYHRFSWMAGWWKRRIFQHLFAKWPSYIFAAQRISYLSP
jgi:hypothetical protein